MSTLVYVTETGRHVTDEDIARDAAEATMGDLGMAGTAGRLAVHLAYYADGGVVTPDMWRRACAAYAALRELYWLENETERPSVLDELDRIMESREIRAWAMPRFETAIAAE